MKVRLSFRTGLQIFHRSFNRWLDHNAPRLGAALAFYALLSLAPLMVMVVAISSVVFGSQEAGREIVNQVCYWLGDAAASSIASIISHSQHPSAGIVSGAMALFALFFGASGIFSELRSALNLMWDVRAPSSNPIHDILRQKAFSFLLVIVAELFLLGTILASVVFSLLGRLSQSIMPIPPSLLEGMNFFVSFLILVLLFSLIFWLVPDVRLPSRVVFVGGGITAILFSLGRIVLDLYFAKAKIGSAYGAAGSLVAVIVWVYYSAQIFLFGAEITHVWAELTGPREHAMNTSSPEKQVAARLHARL